jgi:hypothetical protein
MRKPKLKWHSFPDKPKIFIPILLFRNDRLFEAFFYEKKWSADSTTWEYYWKTSLGLPLIPSERDIWAYMNNRRGE